MNIFLIIYIVSVIVMYFLMRNYYSRAVYEYNSLSGIIIIILAIFGPIVNTALGALLLFMELIYYIVDSISTINMRDNYYKFLDKIFFIKRKPPF